MPENEISKVKTKLRNTCEKYCHVKVPYKQKKIISNLSNRKDIVVLKVDKGRGVVIMDRSNYAEKCMSLLSSNQCKHIPKDPTKSLEVKVQRATRKIKSKLSEQEYKKLYPTGSCPGKFYGTAKIHKLPVDGGINELPIRPIVSNLNTATYNLAKYLSKLLSPLRQSGNTVKNIEEFIEELKQQKLSKEHKMLSFDVKSLFTNVPLNRTIDIILKRMYEKNEIVASITKNEMKEMLILCTKNVHFTFESRTYVQTDGVVMGFPSRTGFSGHFYD